MPLRPNFLERFLIKQGLIPAPLIDIGLPGFMMSAMIGAGEIDLFQKMGEGPASLEELAQKTASKKRPLKNLLNVLKELGYVNERKDSYMLTKYARKSLPLELYKNIVPYFSGQFSLIFQHSEKALREEPEEGIIGWERVKNGEMGKSYQISMRWLASSTVKEVISKIRLRADQLKMIDIGGSHGLYCVEMCRKYSNLEATVLDWPIGIENAKQTLAEEKDVASRIDTRVADYNKDEIPSGYDFAYLGNIIHGNSPEQNRALFRKIADATTQGGRIGILDQFDNISGSRFTRSVVSLVGWGLFLFANGRAYKIDDVKLWLKEVGFEKTNVIPLKRTPGFTLLLADKA